MMRIIREHISQIKLPKLLFRKRNDHFATLQKKWTKRNHQVQDTLWENHKETFLRLKNRAGHFAIGSLGGVMLLTSAAPPLPHPGLKPDQYEAEQIDDTVFVAADLAHVVPNKVRPLTREEEDNIAKVLSRNYGITVSAELDGKRLNRSYGYIGAEQHLTRYPGDTIASHFETYQQAAEFSKSGMAPGRGAWGYFASSKEAMSKEDSLREQYYIAVQTFLIPDYNQRVAEYRDFFRFRKMLVVNPQNGKAVVAVIGDAGPAQFTGKQLGGSPEVMKYLSRVDGAQKGSVLYFFIADKDKNVPLGPIKVQ